MATGAGVNANQIRTAAPSSVDLAASANAEGTSTSLARADHAHAPTGVLPVAHGGTGAATASANQVLAGPTTGSAAAPAFRALVAADLPAGTGTVTSVAQTVPVEFVIGGSPITGAGTLAITKATQVANQVWAGPTTGADAQPTFRALVTADLPSGTGTMTQPQVLARQAIGGF